MLTPSGLHRSIEAWFHWLLITGLGWLIAVLAGSLAVALLARRLPADFSLAAGGMLTGGLIGWTQWFFLRPDSVRPGAWTAFSAVGWSAGLFLMAFTWQLPELVVVQLAGGGVAGLLCGLCQWSTLRSRARQSNLWLHRSVFGWTSAAALSLLLVPGGAAGLNASGLMAMAGALSVGWMALVVLSVAVLIALGDSSTKHTEAHRPNW